MKVRGERLIEDVRVRLNLNRRYELMLDDADSETLQINERILAAAPAAVRMVEMDAPAPLLVGSPAFAMAGELPAKGKEGGGVLELPPDWMRLVSVRLEGWESAVCHSVEAGGVMHALARCSGGDAAVDAATPLAVEDISGGWRVLRLYGGYGAVEHAHYRREPRFDRYGAIEVSEPLYPAVVEAIASRLSL